MISRELSEFGDTGRVVGRGGVAAGDGLMDLLAVNAAALGDARSSWGRLRDDTMFAVKVGRVDGDGADKEESFKDVSVKDRVIDDGFELSVIANGRQSG